MFKEAKLKEKFRAYDFVEIQKKKTDLSSLTLTFIFNLKIRSQYNLQRRWLLLIFVADGFGVVSTVGFGVGSTSGFGIDPMCLSILRIDKKKKK